ncbi:MAG: hypothetical protein FE78DRAFT_155272 [Acidomyces sp. 'richmondensis']|nr:MAG: hypothetical protein FE78DRAFT_155272 [Acidomyces sp. 'richmondensis']
MPRVRGPATSTATTTSQVVPLNDDQAEKSARLESRKLLHAQQLHQLKAAASPIRKPHRLSLAGGDPNTPIANSAAADDDDADYGVAGHVVTPMKRLPLLANFEEWMKMATDNKINATNSWNFALIDYFHDMSLLREGDGVNFQKASCTLDGCVKIYTSRVDSVATETGRLLSGLAESGGGRKKQREEGDEEEEEEEEGDGGEGKRKRKKAGRNAEATLAPNFEALRLKKMELEFAVDPLFKKASADFDEGGAKGLLLNHLAIDGSGRIVFDSSDDDVRESDTVGGTRRDSMEPEKGSEDNENGEEEEEMSEVLDGLVDLAALANRFFPDLAALDSQDICPSLKTFELGAGDNGALDLPFLKAPENWRDEHADPTLSAAVNEGPALGLDDDDDDVGRVGGDFDAPPETGFGEGGEAWARDAALLHQPRVHNVSVDDEDEEGDSAGEGCEVGTFSTSANAYAVTLQPPNAIADPNTILSYFDNTAHATKNWAGPEHWKITRIKSSTGEGLIGSKRAAGGRKEKEPFSIDFAAPMTQTLADQLYTRASSNAAISLPRPQWHSRTRNLLPDDKHFQSKDLLTLFLKPKAQIGTRQQQRRRRQQQQETNGEVDEVYWATTRDGVEEEDGAPIGTGNYDADFFQDDNMPLMPDGGVGDGDEDEFADAREAFSPEVDGLHSTGRGGIDTAAGGEDHPSADGGPAAAFGAQLVTQSRRIRPEYVQYARVAKKVDVRRLKENIWQGTEWGARCVFSAFLLHSLPILGLSCQRYNT